MARIRNSGNGCVYYRKDKKRWIASRHESDPITLKRKHIEKSFRTQEEAYEYLKAIMYRKQNPIYIKNNGIPLKALMISILDRKFDSHLISEAQYERVQRTHNLIFKGKIVDKNIEDITPDELQNYLNTFTNYSDSSIKKIYGQFSLAFKYATDRGYLYLNPMAQVLRPKSLKPKKRIRAMTLDEETLFLSYLRNKSLEECPYKNVFLIQLFMGLRIGECLALSHSDIDLTHRKILIHKTLSRSIRGKVIMSTSPKTQAGNRLLPIPDSLFPYIVEQMQYSNSQLNNPQKLLFKPFKNEYTTAENANLALRKILRELNIEQMSSHSLRHTFATRAIESGMNAAVLQRLMGHKDIATTLNIYTDIFDSYKAAELEKMNEYYLQNNLLNNSSTDIITIDNNSEFLL